MLGAFSHMLNALVVGLTATTLYFGTHAPPAQPVEVLIPQAELHCLQQNIYFESRNQNTNGQKAVAWVVLNRVASSRYPNNICEVVWQPRQFSWTHDGKPDRPSNNILEQRAWKQAGIVAETVLADWLQQQPSPVGNAIMYHANYVQPYWVSAYDRVTSVDDHIFYE